jgi:hypothetical protein
MNSRESPGVLFRMHLWSAARWLPVGAKRRTIEELLTNATPPKSEQPYRGLEADSILDSVRAVTSRPWRMRGRRCLREGLLGFRFLRLAGYSPQLHFGVEPGSVHLDHLRAHCWIVLDGQCVMNPPSATMLPIFFWDGDAVRQPDEPARSVH